MESYEKIFLRELIEHKDDLSDYVSGLYKGEGTTYSQLELNGLFSGLKKQGYISCMNYDNIMENVSFTLKGKNINESELRLSDKEELLNLIGKTDSISKCFHRLDGEWALFEMIHDVPEFQNWLQEIMFLLQSIQDKKYNQYIIDTINLCKHHWNGTDDRKKFNELSGRLASIAKNIDKYFPVEDEEKKTEMIDSDNKKYDVFISHANKDKLDYVEDLYQTISKLGISVFYDKETFEWGDNWKQKIYDGVDSSEFAIIVISDNYFGREWTEKELQSFLNRQNSSGEKIILPLLHGISVNDLCQHYPELGEIQAISDSQYDIKDVAILFARQLLKRYRKNG